MPARASASRARSGSGPGASSRAARPAPWSRAPRHAEKRLFEIGAGHLEIAHDHAALEQAAQHRLGLVAQQTHAVVGELEALHRQRSEEHTSELQSLRHLVCRLLLEKKKKQSKNLQHIKNIASEMQGKVVAKA